MLAVMFYICGAVAFAAGGFVMYASGDPLNLAALPIWGGLVFVGLILVGFGQVIAAIIDSVETLRRIEGKIGRGDK